MKKNLISEVRQLQKIAGILKEDYRSKQDNLTIIQRCIELGDKDPEWNELKQAAIEAYEEYTEDNNRSQLDSAVENILDTFEIPPHVIPYQTPDEDSRGMFRRQR